MRFDPIPNQPYEPGDPRLAQLRKDSHNSASFLGGRAAAGASPQPSSPEAKEVLAEDQIAFTDPEEEDENPFETLIRRVQGPRKRRKGDREDRA